MALNYLIIGAGYIGSYLATNLPNAKLVTGKIYDADVLKDLLLNQYPSHVLINCAGKTGRPNVDWCEDHKDQTFGGNVGIPVMIGEACKEIKQYWVHIGSGCIYEGYDKEWTEEDEPNFTGSFYSKTKLWSQRILEEFDEPCILRIRMPIDEYLSDRCYISKIAKYAKQGLPLMNDLNSMTVLSDLVKVIQFLTEKGHTGTWNAVNRGSISISQILELYRKYGDPNLKFITADTEEIQGTLKARRSNCILSVEKLWQEGCKMPLIVNQVENILKNLEWSKLEKKEGTDELAKET